MRTRELGGQGLEVTEHGLGCMGMSEFYGTAEEGEAVATIPHYLDLGGNFLDTADMYGPFANERLVGRAVRDRREWVVVATKFGNQRGEDGSFLGVNGRPDYVRRACDASLERLGVAFIDLYYHHRVDSEVPIEETVGAMAELVEEGKVKYLGLSEAAPETIRRAHAVHPISALQTEYSLWSRDPEDAILLTVRELGIGFVAYSPLGRGFLSGAIRSLEDLDENDFRRRSPRFQGKNFERNLELVDRVRELAEAKGGDAWSARARLGTPPGRRRRAHPGHEAAPLPRGEHGRRGDRAVRGRARAHRRRGAARRRGGRALSRHVDRQPLARDARDGPSAAPTG